MPQKALFVVRFLSLFLVPLLIAQCTRDESSAGVLQVSILRPSANQLYKEADTIRVSAAVSGSQSIDYVRIAVVNDKFVSVLPVQNLQASGSFFEFETEMVVNNISLESGLYYVQVRAFAGAESSTAYASIYISVVEKTLESVLAVCTEPDGTYAVYNLPLDGAAEKKISLAGDYLGASVQSAANVFYTCGNLTGNLQAWRLADNASLWFVAPPFSPPFPLFTGFYADEEVFVASPEAFITGYNTAGLTIFKSQLYSNGYFTEMKRVDSRLFAVFEPFNGLFNTLMVFNYPGGTLFQRVDFQGDVVRILTHTDEKVLIFINYSNSSAIFEYNVATNSLVKLKDLNFGRISAVSMSGTENAFLVFQDGVYWYRPGNNSLVKYLSFEGEIHITDDFLTNSLYVGKGNQIKIYRLPSSVPSQSFELPESIRDLFLKFNK